MAANVNDDNEPDWRHSEAKKLLSQLIARGDIPRDGSMKPKIVWNAFCLPRHEFLFFKYPNFPSRLRSLLKTYNGKVDRAGTDVDALAHDRILFPKATHNHRGEPRWEGSEAERLLKLDVDDQKHKTVKPIELYKSRPEYYEHYPLEIFRNHIYQEVRLRKFVLQYYDGTRGND
jgi:hypothetical protein